MTIINRHTNVKQLLLDTLNLIERTQLTLDEVEFETPTKVQDSNPIRNTSVKINIKHNSKRTGSKTLLFNRIHKSALPIINFNRTNQTRLYEILDAISINLNIPLSQEDVEDYFLDVNSTNIQIDFNFKDTSLLFYDGPEISVSGTLPTYTVAPGNILLSEECDGYKKILTFTDGNGGEYKKLIDFYSQDCGFTGTTPTPITTTQPPTTNQSTTTTTLLPTTTVTQVSTTATQSTTTQTPTSSLNTTTTLAPTSSLSTTLQSTTNQPTTTITTTLQSSTTTLTPSTTTTELPTTTPLSTLTSTFEPTATVTQTQTPSTTIPTTTEEPTTTIPTTTISTLPPTTSTLPPTTIDPSTVVIDNNTWLILDFENSFIDLSQSSRTPTIQSGIHFEQGSRTNNYCAVVDNINDLLKYSINLADLNNSSGITVEFDIYIPESTLTGYFLGTNDNSAYCYISPNGENSRWIEIFNFIPGLNPYVAVNVNHFHHIAFCYDLNTGLVKSFLNGVEYYSGISNNVFSFSNEFVPLGIFSIGQRDDLFSTLIKIDNLIISKVCKYTENFTPHTGIPSTTIPVPTTTAVVTTTQAPTTTLTSTVTTTLSTTVSPTTTVTTTVTTTPTTTISTTPVTTAPTTTNNVFGINDFNLNVLLVNNSGDFNLNSPII